MARESSTESNENNQEQEERVQKLARRIRHIGYGICGGILMLLAGFLIYNVIPAFFDGQAHDPYTHELYQPVQDAAGSATLNNEAP